MAGIEMLTGYIGNSNKDTGDDFDVEVYRNGDLVHAAPVLEVRRFKELVPRVRRCTCSSEAHTRHVLLCSTVSSCTLYLA